jgi:fumarate hydratase class II
MNVNEVIANRCIQLVGGDIGSKVPVHPNDDVNLGQSSNDTFATAMHIAAHGVVVRVTLPALRRLRHALDAKAQLWADVVRVGRTHLQDATPITVGQAFSAYVSSLNAAIDDLELSTAGLEELAIGGTAVGTGLNAPAGFDEAVASEIAALTGQPFRAAANKFAAIATVDQMMRVHGALRDTAAGLVKLANDLRWLGSGPHAGIGELRLPANEPGSSIMPGKVNPTQAEAMVMVCYRVMGADVAVGLAAAGGNFELNTCRPLVIATTLDSALTLGDACESFTTFMVDGAELDAANITEHLDRSVMLVTALTPVIGYDRAADIAQRATSQGLTLRAAALADGVDAALFDRAVDPLAMTRPAAPDADGAGPGT